MKKFKFFTMALAAMSMVACSNEDEMGRNNPGVHSWNRTLHRM